MFIFFIQLIFSTFLFLQNNQTNNMNKHVPANCQQMPEKTIVNEAESLCDKLRLCSLVTKIDEIKDDTGIVYFLWCVYEILYYT